MLPPIVWETSGEISMLIKLEDSIVLLPFVSPCQVYPSYSGSQLFIRVVYCAGILLCGLSVILYYLCGFVYFVYV